MTTARFDTVSTIVNEAAVELGLSADASVDVFASTNAIYVQLRTLLKSCGQELIDLPSSDWPSLHKGGPPAATATAAAGGVLYGINTLPTDFGKMLPGTLWNQTDNNRMREVTPQAWEAALAGGIAPDPSYALIDADRLLLYSDSAGDGITFRYQSRYWLAETATPTVLSKAAPTANTDVVFFTPLLIKRLLKLRYALAKGLPEATACLADFESTLAVEQGKHAPAMTLNLQGRSSGHRFIDGANVLDRGYGT